MPQDDAPEVVFDLEQLLVGMTRALAQASGALPAELAKLEHFKSAPYTYHIPRMSAEVTLSFTYSDGKVKGILRKKSTSNVQEVLSTLKLEVVAVPAVAPVPAVPGSTDDSELQ